MRTIASLFLASFLFACGGSDGSSIALPTAQQTEPAPSDPKPGDTTGDPKPGDPNPNPTDPKPTDPTLSTCNSLANDAQAIKSIAVIAIDAPAPNGGTIPSGTFHLMGITLYAGKSGKSTSIPITLQNTVKVSGNTVEQVLDGTTPDGKTIAERSTESFTTNGNEVTFTKTCDGSGSRTATFTATSSELTMFLVNDVGQTVAYKYR